MIFIFDTETTGLPKAIGTDLRLQPRCIEICARIYNKKGELQEEFEAMYNPGFNILPQITRITGITNNDLANKSAYSLSDLEHLNSMLKKCTTVVAHNLSFDEEIMNFEAQRLSYDVFVKWPREHVCTVEQTMHLKGRRMRLVELYEFLFGRPYEQTHRAKDDVKILTACYFRLIEKKEI